MAVRPRAEPANGHRVCGKVFVYFILTLYDQRIVIVNEKPLQWCAGTYFLGSLGPCQVMFKPRR